MTEEKTTKRKKHRTRSPSYPAIDLKEAIELANKIKISEGAASHYIPYQVALSHWGYTAKSGLGIVKIAALKKYGLIDDRGASEKREIKLTDIATKILFYFDNDPDNNDLYKFIKQVALTPAIYKELWELYSGELPSDATIKSYLVFQRENGTFSENIVDDVIKQFRATISFANLSKDDNISGDEQDKSGETKEEFPVQTSPIIQSGKLIQGHPATIKHGQIFSIPIKFPSGKIGQMQIPDPLTNAEWEQMMKILEVYKPSIVNEQEAGMDDDQE